MKKIKILHIIKSLGRGGAETLLPETLRLHDKNKFEFNYIYFLPWKDQMVSEIEQQGGKVTCIKAKNNIVLLSKYNEVADYCKMNEIDLIHAHLPWSGFLSRFVFKSIGVPLVYTEHNIQERYHIATRNLNKLTFNWQSLAIGVSSDVSASIHSNIRPSIPVKTILNGVDTTKFKRNLTFSEKIRATYDIPIDAIVIGNIAVFRAQKDLITWVKAFKYVYDSNQKVYGLLVGAGPKQEEVKKLIKDFELEKQIILPGLQTDTVSFFSAMDIFMMSSQFEGLPIALLEAMSMECAIVSTRAGGVVEVIDHKQNGLLSDVGDANELSANCSRVLRDSSFRLELQKAARKRVVDSFSLSNMVKGLETRYINLVSDSQV